MFDKFIKSVQLISHWSFYKNAHCWIHARPLSTMLAQYWSNIGLIPILRLQKEIVSKAENRLVVDEDDLKWVTNEKKILLFLKQFHDFFVVNPLGFRKFSYSLQMQNNALMHCEGLKG